MTTSILKQILDTKQGEISRLKNRFSLQDLMSAARNASPARNFTAALREGKEPRVIAEVKKASPSKGVIREDFDPVQIASGYERAGAAAVSVLTDEHFFQGNLQYLSSVKEEVLVPVLRKDFLTDPHQIYQSRATGADSVLLIVAAMDGDGMLADLIDVSRSLAMEPLVEVHNNHEAETAIRAGAEIIGINNRDLTTFEVDLSLSHRLARAIHKDKVIIAESGITSLDDMLSLSKAGVDAFLIGESLMRTPDPGNSLSNMMEQWRRA